MRESISLKTRFEVLKRDKFTCTYCGAHPPNAVLVIDHVTPVAKGGDGGIENLTTACFECNAGKRDSTLPNRFSFKRRVWGAVRALPHDKSQSDAIRREHTDGIVDVFIKDGYEEFVWRLANYPFLTWDDWLSASHTWLSEYFAFMSRLPGTSVAPSNEELLARTAHILDVGVWQ